MVFAYRWAGIFRCDEDWNSTLDMPLNGSLSGLRSLRLRIDHAMHASAYQDAKMAGSLYQRTECDGLRILSTLPLTEVDILVRNPSGASGDAVWSKSDRKEYHTLTAYGSYC